MTNGFVLATDPTLPPPGLEGAVYAIGNFDGMHLGHQAVIERAAALARSRAAPSALLTFEPHPADYFAQRPVAFRLTPPKIKASLCARLGLSGIVFMTFDASLAEMSAEEFVAKVLVARLGVAAWWSDGTFISAKAEPVRRRPWPRPVRDTALPSRSSPKLKTAPEKPPGSCPLPRFAGLSNGETFRRGARPRAQLFGLGSDHLRPASWTHPRRSNRQHRAGADQPARARSLCGGRPGRRRRFSGVASFGVRPTFDNGAPLLEVHLFDFDGDLYGREMEVEFIERIRGEHKFDSIPSLVAEMERDKERARAILAVRP